MNKKLLFIIVVAIIALLAIVFVAIKQKQSQKPEFTKQELLQKFQTLKTQYEEAKTQGYDVFEVERLGREAKQAFDRGSYKNAKELLDKASKLLKEKKYSSTPTPLMAPTPSVSMPLVDKTKAMEKLSQVKVASVYENIVDRIPGDRAPDEIAVIFNETKTDFVFRGFWKGVPKKNGMDKYKNLKATINTIKDRNPNIIFSGAVPAQRIWRTDFDPRSKTGIIDYPATWNMALNPQKWGLGISREQLQCKIAKERQMFSGDCDKFDPEKINAYFPDITDENFQELFLSWIKLQIDSGADAIWIDMLFKQVNILNDIVGHPNHPAIRDTYKNITKVVEEIHKYGEQRYNKYVYVGTWEGFQKYDFPLPNIDFVTIYPYPHKNEIYPQKAIDKERWINKINNIRSSKLSGILIFSFIDWGVSKESPIGYFSQKLTPQEQRELLRNIDEFTSSQGVIFAYPVHGGYMGPKDKIIKSFGYSTTYDSLAPEFQTYETIKELAHKKNVSK